jgi:hypothetical protein
MRRVIPDVRDFSCKLYEILETAACYRKDLFRNRIFRATGDRGVHCGENSCIGDVDSLPHKPRGEFLFVKFHMHDLARYRLANGSSDLGVGYQIPRFRPKVLDIHVAADLYAAFAFDDRDRVVGPIAQDIVGTFLAAALRLTTDKGHAAIGESALFVDGVARAFPACRLQSRNNEFSTDITREAPPPGLPAAENAPYGL